MNLCSINHLVLFFIMLVIVFIVHKMFYNKKNIETFTNAGWKLNHDGQLCNESLGCHSIGTVTSNNKVCDVSGSNCVTMTTTGSGSGDESQSSVSEPVDCEMDSWGSWGSCVPNTGSCGSDAGSRSRTRSTITEGSNGGSACGPNTETEPCDLEACPEPVDCEMTWGSWTCEVEGSSCGSGIQTRYGSVSEPARNGGSCGSNIEYGSSCVVDCETPPN